MTMRLSTGLRNFLANGGSIAQALRNGRMEIYTGAQPASADAATTGTRLVTITNNGGVFTPEVAAQGGIEYSGSAGTISAVTVGGVNLLSAPVPFSSTLANTIANLIAAINAGTAYPEYFATVSPSGTGILINGAPGAAATPNGLAVATTTTGGLTTLTSSPMAGGSASANGLQFTAPSGGAITLAGVWQGTNAAAGTAGWFRQYGCFQDGGGLDSIARWFRIDGAIATSGAEMNLSNTAFVSGAITMIQNWAMTVPAQ